MTNVQRKELDKIRKHLCDCIGSPGRQVYNGHAAVSCCAEKVCDIDVLQSEWAKKKSASVDSTKKQMD